MNDQRLRQIPEHCFSGSSFDKKELEKNSHLAVDYVVATPRMAHYMEYSTRVYQIYLKYLAPEDIHVYSIDEIMCDVTDYLNTYGMTAKETGIKNNPGHLRHNGNDCDCRNWNEPVSL